MNTIIEAAISAETILLTDKNTEPSIVWLRSIGLDAPDFSRRRLWAASEGRTYVISSNSSIAPDIAAGNADFGLIGSDKYLELTEVGSLQYEPVGKLACRFVLAMPSGADLNRTLRVATSYPRQFESFLAETSIAATLGPVRPGKVEGAVAQGIADAVFDLTDTGDTLRANNLEIIADGGCIELGGIWRI
jgi:ATP phosphoribosyltransferase